MKIYITTFFLLFGAICFSQSNCFYINNLDSLAYSIVDSVLFNGSCQGFYKENKVKEECYYKDGKLVYSKGFYKSGQISDSSSNFDYKINSFEYYDWWSNGNQKSKWTFVNRKSNGQYTIYYKNGNLKEEGNSIMAKSDGIRKHYYKNGIIKHEYFYRNDSLIYSKHFDKRGIERIRP